MRKVDFRSSMHRFSCVKERLSLHIHHTSLESIPRYTCSPLFLSLSLSLLLSLFFFLSFRDNATLSFLVASSAWPFPHAGLFAMTSDSIRRARRNIIVTFTQISRPMLEANQDGSLRSSSAPGSWIRMNINRPRGRYWSFIDPRGHQDVFCVSLSMAAR